MNINIDTGIFNDIYLPYLDNEDRYLVFYGGGSSGKSYFIVQRWIYMLLKRKMNLLVVRQTGDTNRNSTFALFLQVIRNWNIEHLFKISESNLRIQTVNGNEVIFKRFRWCRESKIYDIQIWRINTYMGRRSNWVSRSRYKSA